jgi:hypothetical protein
MSEPSLNKLQYRSDNFNHCPPALERALWDFVRRPDNVIRTETATSLDRAAVEALSNVLVAEFGIDISAREVKQVIGHMVRQVMEAMGYEVDRKMRITRPGLFTSGLRFRPAGVSRDRSIRVTKQDSQAWLQAAEKDAFNRWLDAEVEAADGTVDLEKLRSLAKKYGIERMTRRLKPGFERLELGVLLRRVVPVSEYEVAEESVDRRIEEENESRRDAEIALFGAELGSSRAEIEAEIARCRAR